MNKLCIDCKQPLVKIGTARKNGAAHDDWPDRTLHKECWKARKAMGSAMDKTPIGKQKVPFGKYRNKMTWDELLKRDMSYVTWFMNQTAISKYADVRKYILTKYEFE